MKRTIATLLISVFVVGVLLGPVLHRLESAHDHHSHNSAQCPACQLGIMPIVTAAPQSAPTVLFVVVEDLYVPKAFPSYAELIGTSLARGPPAA